MNNLGVPLPVIAPSTTLPEHTSSATAQYTLPSRVGCSVMAVFHRWSRPWQVKWQSTRSVEPGPDAHAATSGGWRLP